MHMRIGKRGYQTIVVKAIAIAAIPQCRIDRIAFWPGARDDWCACCFSIQIRLHLAARIVPLQAGLSYIFDAASEPNYQGAGLHHICTAHCSYRCVPVGRLAAS